MSRQRIILAIMAIVLAFNWESHARNYNVQEFNSCLAGIDTLLAQRCGSRGHLRLKSVSSGEGNSLDFNFTVSLSDYPLRPSDGKWLRKMLGERMPEKFSGFQIGKILCDGMRVSELSVRHPGNDGIPLNSACRTVPSDTKALLTTSNRPSRGLYGRHIALWNSHGLYFNNNAGEWKWQRPDIYGYNEDLCTYGFVEEFLAPMLENAGAAVLIPRERDLNTEELIMDFDNCPFNSARTHGTVSVPDNWQNAAGGFKDYKEELGDDDPSPFTEGTYNFAHSVRNSREATFVRWRGKLQQRGYYAVYVSYKTLPQSVSSAKYVIHRLGADEEIIVNQRTGSGTWIYLGRFEFEKGEQCLVSLSNQSQENGIVTADAVKIGGGMGNVSRGRKGECGSVSSMPRAYEGARYFMRWSGAPEHVWNRFESGNDYKDDYGGRGPWVAWLSGGSQYNPKAEGLGIPVDLSLAFHTDSGHRPEHDVVGTLAIYSRIDDQSDKLPNGVSRNTCRELTDFIQTQTVGDIRALWDGQWKRRPLWNRAYAESRTCKVPATLLELLSHENFEDLKYAFDPAFRFTVARSCYKGILKYLSMHYGRPYKVQPLPPRSFSAHLCDSTVTLEWTETMDSLEKTAKAESFILYTRIDGGGWNKGENIKRMQAGKGIATREIKSGHVYSYKVVAVNAGGLSFPSETLSVGIGGKDKVLIVNGFTRIGGPSWFNNGDGGDFERYVDSGVPYLADIHAGGNSFDYPFVHGSAILKAGYSFESCSASAFCSSANPGKDCFAIDLIYGKQCRHRTATRTAYMEGCFSLPVRQALLKAFSDGCGLVVSGSYIASEAYHNIFGRDECEALTDTSVFNFTTGKLGYRLGRSYACKNGVAHFTSMDETCHEDSLSFPTAPCKESYCVESPDALEKLGKNSREYLQYAENRQTAALRSDMQGYRVVAFGFPLELIREQDMLERIFEESLEYIKAGRLHGAD